VSTAMNNTSVIAPPAVIAGEARQFFNYKKQ
jgi:hypothetical protein